MCPPPYLRHSIKIFTRLNLNSLKINIKKFKIDKLNTIN